MAERDDDFLSRWSRRKAEARRGLRKKPAAGAPEAAEAEARETAALTDASAPSLEPHAEPPPEDESVADRAAEFEDFDFDALDYESDYTQFMGKGVPEAVRRRALRKLWHSNPILANLDGLNDYDEDFTDAALAVDVLQSAYKVGRGYLTDEDVAEMEGDDAEEIDGEAAGPDAEHDVASRAPAQAPDPGPEPAVETPDDRGPDRADGDETA